MGNVPSVTTLFRCTGLVSRLLNRGLELRQEKTDVRRTEAADDATGRLILHGDPISGGDEL